MNIYGTDWVIKLYYRIEIVVMLIPAGLENVGSVLK
jgi:hypothetical protein